MVKDETSITEVIKITGVILIHCNIINKNQESCIHLFLIDSLINY